MGTNDFPIAAAAEPVDSHPIYKDLEDIELKLDQIFLDPNNPRFVPLDWDNIEDERVSEQAIQDEAKLKLERKFSINKLELNMEVNGFLPIDRVIVRRIQDNQFIVLEGNRRICAAKNLQARKSENPYSVNDEVAESIQVIKCLLYTGDNPEAAWVFQGLRHIIGIYEWSAFNKAKLLVSMKEDEGISLTEVGKRFGITAYGAGQWARGYYAFKQANESSDYSREVNEKAYPFFQELFSKSNSAFREWMDWNEKESKFDNELNFNEFLSWLYPRDNDTVEEIEEDTDIIGDWDKRRLTKRDDLRTISFLIRSAKEQFEFFRSSDDIQLERAHALAIQKQYEEEAKKNLDRVVELFDNLEETLVALRGVPFTVLRNEKQRVRLFELIDQYVELFGELKA